jgi:hypothetical protein
MAEYKCPRCMEPVRRGEQGAVSRQFGVVGMLISAAAAGFECAKCGPIPKAEFPPDVRSEMARGSIGLAVGAVVVFGVCIAVLIALNS